MKFLAVVTPPPTIYQFPFMLNNRKIYAIYRTIIFPFGLNEVKGMQ